MFSMAFETRIVASQEVASPRTKAFLSLVSLCLQPHIIDHYIRGVGSTH